MKKVKWLAVATAAMMACTACSNGSGKASETTAEKQKESTVTGETQAVNTTAGTNQAEAEKENVNWPEKEVTLVVPASAGGGTDIYARIIAAYFQKVTGKPMVVENQTTGNGTVAYEEVRQADPDGYTLLLYHPSLYISYYTGQYKYSPVENFTPLVSAQQSSGQCIVVRADSKWNTLKELVDDCKSRPQTILCGIQNNNTTQFIFDLLQKDADCKFKMVEAGGQSDKVAALLGGHIEVCAIGAAQARQYVESGDMRALAITSQEASPFFPEFETAVSLGYPNTYWTSGQIVYGPVGMDPAIAEKINSYFVDFENDPDVKTALETQSVISPYRNITEVKEWAQTQDKMVKTVADVLGYKY